MVKEYIKDNNNNVKKPSCVNANQNSNNNNNENGSTVEARALKSIKVRTTKRSKQKQQEQYQQQSNNLPSRGTTEIINDKHHRHEETNVNVDNGNYKTNDRNHRHRRRYFFQKTNLPQQQSQSPPPAKIRGAISDTSSNLAAPSPIASTEIPNKKKGKRSHKDQSKQKRRPQRAPELQLQKTPESTSNTRCNHHSHHREVFMQKYDDNNHHRRIHHHHFHRQQQEQQPNNAGLEGSRPHAQDPYSLAEEEDTATDTAADTATDTERMHDIQYDDSNYHDYNDDECSYSTSSSAEYPGAHRIYDDHRVRLNKEGPVADPNHYNSSFLQAASNMSTKSFTPGNMAENDNSSPTSTSSLFAYLSNKRNTITMLMCMVVVIVIVTVVVVVVVAKPNPDKMESYHDMNKTTTDPLYLQRVQQLTQIIIQNGWTDSQKFENDVSPQALAVQQLAQAKMFSDDDFDDEEIDKTLYVVAVLYFALHFPFMDGWISNIAADAETICNLEFITCNNNNAISSLVIPDGVDELDATLPQEWFLLSSLKALSIVDNNLVHLEPPMSSLAELPSLEHLDLNSNNNLGIEIPNWLYKMTDLEYLNLESCSLIGTLSSEIGNLVKLNFLAIGDNYLSGELPTQIGLLTNIQEFLLSANTLTGPIPLEIGQLTKLVTLDIWLTGYFPEETQFLSNLETLIFGGGISGTIETWIGTLTNLKRLSLLGVPELSGSIPTEIGNLSMLTSLIVQAGISFSGPLPSEIGRLTMLEKLALSDIPLTGVIPTELGLLSSNLDFLYLSGTEFIASIPTEIGNITSLVNLRLDFIAPPQYIPSEIGKLVHLENLRIKSGNTVPIKAAPEVCELPNLVSICTTNQGLVEHCMDIPCHRLEIEKILPTL